MQSKAATRLAALDGLVGVWATEATHPATPGIVVRGTVTIEWLEGERFQIHRARTDHPDFPDAISIVGDFGKDRVEPPAKVAQERDEDASLGMHYFDSRGVFRVYEVSVDERAWHYWREAPGFSQRFTGTFEDGGDTIVGMSQLDRDGTWKDDLQITYRRRR
jgi:hypothetical protein